jgi:hypothetical protein
MKKLLLLVCFGCLSVALLSAQELEKGVKEAVTRFAERQARPLEVNIGEMTLRGGDAPSDLSPYLYEVVKHYAVNDLSRKFIVVEATRGPTRPDEPQKGIIKGTFALGKDTVDVSLELVKDGKVDGSYRFTVPLAELTRRGITVVPVNSAVIEKQEQIFKALSETAPAKTNTPPVSAAPANQNIKIQAFFNSESMTYKHRDELHITVMADRDCYFKVIHIDVDNQMKMIYPNSNDRDNFLRANVPRDIFEKARYMLYEPYGTEVILVVASAQKFVNIEQEYAAPWVLATVDTVRNAVKGNRGGDLELGAVPITFSGEGEAKYKITILKPDEEYSYTRPANMEAYIQDFKNDITKKGGVFHDGNEQSGYYTLDGIRGSYRVPRNAPDTIQFTAYYMDKYTRSPGVRTTRGSSYEFKFAKPQNISQAVQTVRSSIMESGGTFAGNEQQGNFRASGITGKYQVADMVNVTISEKPFVVPNSMIENEVKKYFGVR